MENPEEFTDWGHHDLMDMFQELSFREKWSKVRAGLKQPKDSGAYKWARLQMYRLSAPIAAVIVPCLVMVALTFINAMSKPETKTVQVDVMEVEEAPELEPIKEIEEVPPEPPEVVEQEVTTDEISFESDSPLASTDFSPAPAPADTVHIVKSPMVMKGIIGSRSPGLRGTLLGKHGGGYGEVAVMRALRWLKKNQKPNGSWYGTSKHCKDASVSSTSFALLCYLAHGETPSSPEFGPTVRRAIEFLLASHQGNGFFAPRDGHDYTSPIATYALCEAYAMTKKPEIKTVAKAGLIRVMNGQTAIGGYDYKLNSKSTRNDSSYAGWCMQALKAGYMGGIKVPGLKAKMEKSIRGMKSLYRGDSSVGHFLYSNAKGHGRTDGLTSTGVLCLQLLGDPKAKEVDAGMNHLKNATFVWPGDGDTSHWSNKNYYWYYITQAKFQTGGDTWRKWNKLFARKMTDKQTVIKGGIKNTKGDLVDIGYWNMPESLSGHSTGHVMNTCLATLQLEVYYRYLPTLTVAGVIDYEAEDDVAVEEGPVKIKIDLPF